MPTTPAPGETIVRTVDQQFLDIICSDADLLEAEFDAIIAAEWPEPPADRRGGGAAGHHLGDGRAHHGTDPVPSPVSRPRHPGIGGWARQRSPPF